MPLFRRRFGVGLSSTFRPLALAEQPERWLFVAVCSVTLLLLLGGDGYLHGQGTLGPLGVIPVLAAGWLLSRRLTALVAAVAIVCRVAAMATGWVPPVTGVSQVLTIPILAYIAHLAAERVVGERRASARLEEVRLEVEHASSLEQVKSDFLRLASHELRAPLGVLAGYISMMLDGTLGELPPDARPVVPILAGRLKAMSMLVDQMLETARMEDERLELRLERVDLVDIVRRSADSMRPLAGPGHKLTVETPGSAVATEADAARVETIVTNLIDNAFKYSPEGGDVKCRLATRGSRAQVTVSDHGIGIAAEDKPRLFQRFSRLHEDQNGISGTGLGLYVSRELARRHGGELWVESRAGEGSRFTLELPLREVSRPPPASNPAGAGEPSRKGDRSQARRRPGVA